MKNKIFFEKQADINVKSSFSTNTIQGEIMNQVLKVFPQIKDMPYALEIKNKDMECINGQTGLFIKGILKMI